MSQRCMNYLGLAIAVALITGSSAQAESYYRFWQGWKRPQCAGTEQLFGGTAYRCVSADPSVFTYPEFLGALNQIFVPATLRTGAVLGAGRGILSYLPAITFEAQGGTRLSALRARGIDLPDETAIVEYASQADYNQIRNETDLGRAYGPLHGIYFDMGATSGSRSRSAVPHVFTSGEAAAIGSAYLMREQAWPLQRAAAHFMEVRVFFWTRPASTPQDQFLRNATAYLNELRVRSSASLVNSLVLIAADYWIEYRIGPRTFSRTDGNRFAEAFGNFACLSDTLTNQVRCLNPRPLAH